MNEDTVSLIAPKTLDQNPNSSFAHLPLCQYECSVATINCDVNKKEKMCLLLCTDLVLETPREFLVSKSTTKHLKLLILEYEKKLAVSL